MNENVTCVLLHGRSASGKTETARQVIRGRFGTTTVVMDHKQLAAPLRILHSIRTETAGPDSKSRQLWLIHGVLTDLFPYGSVNYEDVIELVYDIYDYPIQTAKNEEGQIVRDRDFMTSVADMIHSLYPNVFADYLVREIKRLAKDVGEDTPYRVVVSDFRLEDELNTFKENFETIVVNFDVSDTTQAKRLLKRDGQVLTERQKKHPTQQPLPTEFFDYSIDTETLSLDEQIDQTLKIIESTIKQDANA